MSLSNSEQFYWLDRIGSGSTRVRKVRHKFNSQVQPRHPFVNRQESACKEITPDSSSMFDVRCIDAVARSGNPHIVQVQDRWADQWPTPKVYVQMELCYGDLNQYIEATRSAGTPIDHRAVWKIVLQIVDGLTYAHELGWSHRNLKPRNGNILTTTRLMNSFSKGHWDRPLWRPAIRLEDLRLGSVAYYHSSSHG